MHKDKVVAFARPKELKVEYIEINEVYEAPECRNWIPKGRKTVLPTVPKSDFVVSPAEISMHR